VYLPVVEQILKTLLVLSANNSEAAFAEFWDCGKAKAKFEEIRYLLCGSENSMQCGLAHELESVWMLLLMASVICFPLFACTCQIVKYSQQVQLGPWNLQDSSDDFVELIVLKCRLALGGPYAAAGRSEDMCLAVKDSLSYCLEIPRNRMVIKSEEECNGLVRQVRRFPECKQKQSSLVTNIVWTWIVNLLRH
jgi:hypothetical protein